MIVRNRDRVRVLDYTLLFDICPYFLFQSSLERVRVWLVGQSTTFNSVRMGLFGLMFLKEIFCLVSDVSKRHIYYLRSSIITQSSLDHAYMVVSSD